MKGPSSDIRFNEAKKLLDYGFANYEYIENNKKGETLKSVIVDKGVFQNVDAIFEEDNGILTTKSESNNFTYEINLPEKILAPVYEGQILRRSKISN